MMGFCKISHNEDNIVVIVRNLYRFMVEGEFNNFGNNTLNSLKVGTSTYWTPYVIATGK